MSSSTMFVVTADGTVKAHAHFGNSWGSGAFVWTALVEKYRSRLYDKPPPFFAMMDAWQVLWDVVENGKITLEWWEWNVLNWTYDNAMVKREDLPLLVESFTRFEAELYDGKVVCHLPLIANQITELLKGGPPVAICHRHTNVSANPWSVYDETTEEDEPYNTNKGDKHWFVEMRPNA